ncbi:MAG: UDP-N-acetylmuramate dehydrogenase [Flavobacteriaceae bacterium]|nr:UDP-N-acetylmuramate dehydrogenase [Flavobacteriaceae bacterium]
MKNKNISLKPYNSFGLEVFSNNFYRASTETDILKLLNKFSNFDPYILGGGSNILFKNNIDKPIIKIEIKGIEIEKEIDDEIYISVGAGENWSNFVDWCVKKKYGGIENLSLIPGNVGSAPIQNIGAYGVELESVFYSCKAISIKKKKIKIFSKKDCQFSYRNSIFKEKLKNKYIITNVIFKLTKVNHKLNISYKPLKELIEKENISKPTIKNISNFIKKIRQTKLPDPKLIGNCGSFFKNPIVSKKMFKSLILKYSSMPSFNISDNEFKIPAAWLIEKSGFKGVDEGETGTYKKHALVIINHGKATGTEIYNFSQKIKKSVLKKFNILLEEEVNIFE